MTPYGLPNKDADGKTLRTHAEDAPGEWISPTSGPSNNAQQKPKPNRADRRRAQKLMRRVAKRAIIKQRR